MVAGLLLVGSFEHVMLVPGSAHAEAQPLKTLRYREAEETELKKEVAFTNQVCGTTITARILWDTADRWPEDQSIAAACGGALSALEAICRAGADRAAGLKTFQCAGDGTGPTLSGPSLKYGASPGKNGFAETKAFLESRL